MVSQRNIKPNYPLMKLKQNLEENKKVKNYN